MDADRLPPTLDRLVAGQLPRFADKTCLLYPSAGLEVTYREVEEASNRAARFMRRAGVKKGDRVALLLSNVPEVFFCFFGAMKLGAIVVPLSPRLKPAEIETLLADCRPVLTFASRGAETPARPSGRLVRVAGPGARQPWDGYPSTAPAGLPRVQPRDLAQLLYTSGTTGQPKGALRDHASVVSQLVAARRHLRLTSSFRALCIVGLDTGFGLVVNSLLPWACGGSLVLREPLGLADLADFWPSLDRLGVHFFICVSPLVDTLAAARRRFPGKTRSLRYAFCTATHTPKAAVRAFERACGVRLLNHYGLRETGIVAIEPRKAGRRPAGLEPLFGPPRIVDAAGRSLPAGKKGEIVVRCGGQMREYYKRPDLTAQAMRGGWFHTGDLGLVDRRGRLFVLGLLKDSVKKSGHLVVPGDVDEALRLHRDVADCATVGAPDALLGARLVSYVVPRPGRKPSARELIAHCRRLIADYKCPDRVVFRRSLPRNLTGKILRRRLRGR